MAVVPPVALQRSTPQPMWPTPPWMGDLDRGTLGVLEDGEEGEEEARSTATMGDPGAGREQPYRLRAGRGQSTRFRVGWGAIPTTLELLGT